MVIFLFLLSLVLIGSTIYALVLVFELSSSGPVDFIFSVLCFLCLFLGITGLRYSLDPLADQPIKKEFTKEIVKEAVEEPIEKEFTKTVVFEIVNDKLTPVDTILTKLKN